MSIFSELEIQYLEPHSVQFPQYSIPFCVYPSLRKSRQFHICKTFPYKPLSCFKTSYAMTTLVLACWIYLTVWIFKIAPCNSSGVWNFNICVYLTHVFKDIKGVENFVAYRLESTRSDV